jgi:hypothetical protein
VCEVLSASLTRYGIPDEILTDNGKCFTGRFGPHPVEVLFDRILRENGISHRHTGVRSPTTTGKIERFHQSLRREFLDGKTFASLETAQAELDSRGDDLYRPATIVRGSLGEDRKPWNTVQRPPGATASPTCQRSTGATGAQPERRPRCRRRSARPASSDWCWSCSSSSPGASGCTTTRRRSTGLTPRSPMPSSRCARGGSTPWPDPSTRSPRATGSRSSA